VASLAILLGGAFHASGFSRSIEGFFGCGALCSLLLTPMYVHIGKSHSVWVQLAAVLVAAVVLGSLV